MYGLCRESEPVTRIFVPTFRICGVTPLRVSCVTPCDSHTYSLRPAVLVYRGDVHVAVRILRLELGDGAGDADRFAGVEMRREAVMREGVRPGEQYRDDSNS